MNNWSELEAAYADPRFRALLGVIRDAEGVSRHADPYRVAGGGRDTLDQLDTPEFRMWGFTDKTGKSDVSSATGAYQFLRGTWRNLQNKYGFSDFHPRTQDLAALALIKDAGAFSNVRQGDYLGAINKIRHIWASLPGAGYNQQERGYDFIQKSLAKHLGHPVDMQPDGGSHQSRPQIPQTTATKTPTDWYDELFNVGPPSTPPLPPEAVEESPDAVIIAPSTYTGSTKPRIIYSDL